MRERETDRQTETDRHTEKEGERIKEGLGAPVLAGSAAGAFLPAAAGWAGASAAGCVGRGPVGARSAGAFCPLRSGAAAAAVVAAAAATAAAAAGLSWDGLGLRVAVDSIGIHDQNAGIHWGSKLGRMKLSVCAVRISIVGQHEQWEWAAARAVFESTESFFCSA